MPMTWLRMGLGQFLVEVHEHKLIGDTLQCHGIRRGAANKPAADDSDFHDFVVSINKNSPGAFTPRLLSQNRVSRGDMRLACPPKNAGSFEKPAREAACGYV